jgi:hypothetical protein
MLILPQDYQESKEKAGVPLFFGCFDTPCGRQHTCITIAHTGFSAIVHHSFLNEYLILLYVGWKENTSSI